MNTTYLPSKINSTSTYYLGLFNRDRASSASCKSKKSAWLGVTSPANFFKKQKIFPFFFFFIKFNQIFVRFYEIFTSFSHSWVVGWILKIDKRFVVTSLTKPWNSLKKENYHTFNIFNNFNEYSLINRRQLHIFFTQAKIWHRIVFWFREHSYMTSDVFRAFLTYLPTLIRYFTT